MADQLVNQVAKATRFVDFLETHLGDLLDLEQLNAWGDSEWQHATDLFNEARTDGRTDTTPRSTRRAIIRLLNDRRTHIVVDPFAGIGTCR